MNLHFYAALLVVGVVAEEEAVLLQSSSATATSIPGKDYLAKVEKIPFEAMDLNRDGYITLPEVTETLHSGVLGLQLNESLSIEEVKALFDHADVDKTGKIDQTELSNAFQAYK